MTEIKNSPSDEPLTAQSPPPPPHQHRRHLHHHQQQQNDHHAVPVIVLKVRPNDVGYQIVGDVFRDQMKPNFRTTKSSICFWDGDGPAKPNPLLSNMTDETWEDFCHDTVDIINTRIRAALILYGTFLLLYKIPVWIIPALRYNNNNNHQDQVSGDDDNNTEDSEADDSTHEMAHFWYSLYIGFLMFDLVLALIIIWPNGRRAHKEIQEVRDKYAFDFYNAGIHLLYIRDRNAAYWVFRPLWEEEVIL